MQFRDGVIVYSFTSGRPAKLVSRDRAPARTDALVQAVRTMSHCAARMHALREKCEKLDRQLKERKVIDRAKGKLMDTLHLTEKEAHYRIQKKSMDTGRRIVDIAQEILDSEEIAC